MALWVRAAWRPRAVRLARAVRAVRLVRAVRWTRAPRLARVAWLAGAARWVRAASLVRAARLPRTASLLGARRAERRRSRSAGARAFSSPGALIGLLAIWLRLEQRHHGLLYPDGYQYLLMAHGIGEHLRPTTVLGPSGDAFVPSFDAATKPWFAAVVAGIAELGVALRSAAGVVAAVSSGLASIAGALLVLRLTRSAAAAAACAIALLASPTLGFWWGFAGPDGLAVALALTAAWLAAGHAGVAAGVAAGLAIATRPELVVVVVACTVAAVAAPEMRRTAVRAGAAGTLTVALVYAVLRPPLAWSAQLVLAPLAGVLGAGILVVVWRLGGSRSGATAALGILAAGLAVLAAVGRAGAMADVGLAEWPLVLAAAVGRRRAVAGRRPAPAGRAGLPRADGGRRAGRSCAAGAPAAGARCSCCSRSRASSPPAYAYKNPGSERYVANLLPLAGVLVALGVATAASAGGGCSSPRSSRSSAWTASSPPRRPHPASTRSRTSHHSSPQLPPGAIVSGDAGRVRRPAAAPGEPSPAPRRTRLRRARRRTALLRARLQRPGEGDLPDIPLLRVRPARRIA